MWDMIAAERRRLADDLERLTAEQWETQSQCAAWTVRQVAAHVIMPFEVSTLQFLVAMVKNRFDFDEVAIAKSADIAERHTTEELIATLRDNADSHWTPPAPGLGKEVVLTEIVVHGRDIRNAIGMESTVPPGTIEAALAGIKDEATRRDYQQRIES